MLGQFYNIQLKPKAAFGLTSALEKTKPSHSFE